MSTIEEIRNAIKTTLSQAGLNVYETAVDVANSPAVVVEPFLSNYQGAFNMGGDYYEFNLFVLVANKNTREAQHKLDKYLTGRGLNSIREFIFHNSSLGLPDVDANVVGLVKDTYNGNFKASTTSFVGGVLRLCVQII